MPYYNTVPQATQRISASQPEIQSNFGEIDTDFARNHVALINAQAGNRGKHNMVQFVTQANGFVPPVAATEVGLYNKRPEAPFPLTGFQELFITRIGASPLNVPITAKNVYDAPQAAPGAHVNWFYLPCGLQVKYGQNVLNAAAAITINFAGIGGNFTAIPFVYATPGGQAAGAAAPPPIHLNLYTVTTNSFTIAKDGAGNNATFNWFAIGPV